MGIGARSEISFLLARPWTCIIIAIFAELGTFVTLALGVDFFGLDPQTQEQRGEARDAALEQLLVGHDLRFLHGHAEEEGIAGISCMPTTTKLAQHAVEEENPFAIVIPIAMGCNISGVIGSSRHSSRQTTTMKTNFAFWDTWGISNSMSMPRYFLGTMALMICNISGVIVSAIAAGVFVATIGLVL